MLLEFFYRFVDFLGCGMARRKICQGDRGIFFPRLFDYLPSAERVLADQADMA